MAFFLFNVKKSYVRNLSSSKLQSSQKDFVTKLNPSPQEKELNFLEIKKFINKIFYLTQIVYMQQLNDVWFKHKKCLRSVPNLMLIYLWFLVSLCQNCNVHTILSMTHSHTQCLTMRASRCAHLNIDSNSIDIETCKFSLLIEKHRTNKKKKMYNVSCNFIVGKTRIENNRAACQ